jgi:transposase
VIVRRRIVAQTRVQEVIPMSKKKAYSAVDVQRVSMESWLAGRPAGTVWVGVDVGKDDCKMVFRWQDGEFERPVRWENPGQIPLAVACLQAVVGSGRPVQVVIESTGTYGDPFRQALADAGLSVRRVSGKVAKDYAEVFDGVSSQHDGKDAAALAELGSIGKSVAWDWREPSSAEQQLGHEVELVDIYQQHWLEWANRIEAWLARHWPELGKLLALGSVTMLELLQEYGSPAALAADPRAGQKLSGWGGPLLKSEKIAEVIASGRRTLGVRVTEADRRRVMCFAAEALRALRQVQACKKALKAHSRGCRDVGLLASALGLATACVLHVEAGDASEYASGGAYVKALGLNLKERSSGRYKGQLKITKRGSARARRWLYLAALRLVSREGVSGWYARKVARDGGQRKRAVVGIMRKVALGIYRCVRDDVAFDARRLFDEPAGKASGRRPLAAERR